MSLPPGLPAIGAVSFAPPRGTRAVLSNGLTVHLMKDATLPVVHLTAFIRAGKMHDPAGKTGLGELTARLLRDGGTENYTPEAMDRRLELLAASVDSNMGVEEGRADLTALTKDLDAALDIYADMLMRPVFDPEKVKFKITESLEVLRRRNDDPGRAAAREALRAFYGAGHPYGWRSEPATLRAVTREDLQACHAAHYRPGNIILAAAGDFGTEEEMLARLEAKFGNWKGGPAEFSPIPPVAIPAGRRVVHIQKDAQQASIVLVLKGLRRHDPLEYPLTVANEILGGGLSSRLASEIRSRRGLAYTVYSYSAKKPDCGYTLGFCGTAPETTGRAAEELLRQFALMAAAEPGAEETALARDAIVNSFVFRFPTAFDLIAERAAYEYYGYPDGYLDGYAANISAVGPAQALAASRRLLNPADALLLVIGDAAKFDRPLSDFGPVTEQAED
jgi:predicted Zn-dependent peptidase